MKDDRALSDYLIQIALEGAALFSNPEAPPIRGVALEKIVMQYTSVMDIISRLSRRYPTTVLEAFIEQPKLTATELQNEAYMQQWATDLGKHLEVVQEAGHYYSVGVTEDRERKAHLPTLSITTYSVEHSYRFTYEFFQSNDYLAITALGAELAGLLEPGAYIQRDEKRQNASSFKQALAWLLEEAKRGQQIQRYKGLGEMNPDQLWETTMDPSIRRMLSVKIEDAVAADEIFTCLMGDNVESRRQFIETNAMLASNLDV